MSEGSAPELSATKKPEIVVARDNDVTRIVKPEGTYTILYGSHVERQDTSKIPSGVTGFMLDSGDYDYVNRDPNELVKALGEWQQFGSVFAENERLQVPLYFTDPKAPLSALLLAYLQNYVHIGEGVSGAIALRQAYRSLFSHRKALQAKESPYLIRRRNTEDILRTKLTRRGLVKTGVKGVLGAWLATPVISDIVGAAANDDVKERDEIRGIKNKIHPEEAMLDEITLSIRNLVMAHKEQLIMESLGNKPNIVAVMGSMHYGLEDLVVNSPKERLAQLTELKPIIDIAFRDPEFYSYAVLTPRLAHDGNTIYQKSVTEVPELKALVTP